MNVPLLTIGLRVAQGSKQLMAFVVLVALGATSARSATVGEPWTGEPGVSESVSQIMARQAKANALGITHPPAVKPLGRKTPAKAPKAQPISRSENTTTTSVLAARSPQLPGVSFESITSDSSPFIPPDTEGAVGTTQIMVTLNGRFRLFDRTGTPDPAFDVDPDVFFESARS